MACGDTAKPNDLDYSSIENLRHPNVDVAEAILDHQQAAAAAEFGPHVVRDEAREAGRFIEQEEIVIPSIEALRTIGMEPGTTVEAPFRAELREEFAAAGMEEHKDYGFNVWMKHPDGDKVQLDCVDYRNHRIIDCKTKPEKVDDIQLARRNKTQATRHLEAYRHNEGVDAAYEWHVYPSFKDIYNDASDHGSDTAGRELLSEDLQ